MNVNLGLYMTMIQLTTGFKHTKRDSVIHLKISFKKLMRSRFLN